MTQAIKIVPAWYNEEINYTDNNIKDWQTQLSETVEPIRPSGTIDIEPSIPFVPVQETLITPINQTVTPSVPTILNLLDNEAAQLPLINQSEIPVIIHQPTSTPVKKDEPDNTLVYLAVGALGLIFLPRLFKKKVK